MSNAGGLNDDVLAKAHVASATVQGTGAETRGSFDVTAAAAAPAVDDNYYDSKSDDDYEDKPTEEELNTLRRVSGPIHWGIYTIAFAELCERFSYYGSSVLYTNFVMRPLPPGSKTGATYGADIPAGALGMGQKASQGVSLVNQFWAYLVPLFGGWLADAKLGRYKVIHIAIAVSTIAHIILVISAAPGVLSQGRVAFAPFFIGLFTLCCGTGLFKANISPLLAEQNKDTRMRVEVQKGERVIVDPSVTNTRIFLWFYFAINTGAVGGQISMVFVEKYHSFWLAFLLPTILFLICPFVLYFNKKNYHLTPPTGSVLEKFFRMSSFAAKRSGGYTKLNWENAKPSNIPVAERPGWLTYDDAWVDEVRRGLMACKVFLFLPIFFLAYNQMTNNLTSQAGSMVLGGAPNDVIQNLNPLSIIIMIPILDHLIYPGFRKMGFNFTPIKRMTTGFFFAASAMVAAAVMQHYIYQMSPCGDHATICEEGPAPINVWAQCLPYIFVGLAEIFTNVTSYEYAFSKAPENMKSLVMSVNLAMSAVSAALGQAFTPLSDDPLLVWNYACVAIIAFIGGVAFWFCFKHLDHEEDELNQLKKTKFLGTNQPNAAARDDAAAQAQVSEKV
ncbi:Putative proton-dependent oligopeptide transporter family, MFS transporter superfamily [Colletotrichum destructivum]|uniref:Proton-dependent oligopeptide transporter family, MFS transporter superfamily n=1 Tax=Colletotrichum destructivum TaxID=34406 RepID=A0AAX4IUD6_9PEZI|nr:Putative proton-dependent oligopeptide transporter family, MFS transporter superfamily [Colletotrichum destructivum]